ncbi:hypothetical protein [Silvibacterium dinghuense]|nr:hypothetical protein [Silvibacterium dinghuense]
MARSIMGKVFSNPQIEAASGVPGIRTTPPLLPVCDLSHTATSLMPK